MKKIINVLIAFALATAASSLVAQDAASSQSTAPSSQSVAANSTSMSNDGDLTQQLQSKFGQDPAFANAQVSVTNGTALITGTVAAKADKKRAKDLAKSIAGVKHVKEQLSVNPSAGKSTNSAASNNPANASVAPQTPKENSAATASNTSPSTGETSATSNNPNSQASSPTGAPAPTSASSASPAAGENASSAPQNAGNASNENNMAGQGPVSGQASSTPPTTGGVPAASGNRANTEPSPGANAIGANVGGNASSASPNSSGEAGVSINDAATLQSQIQDALQNEPTLRNDSVNVSVTDSTIELSGSVQNSKEKETARRIASSFAGNRRVKDRVTLNGKGAAASAPAQPGLSNNPAATQNPNNNPNAQNPSANNPKANGDASANPR